VISPVFSSDRTLFASVRGQGVYKTTDGGDNWRSANNGMRLIPSYTGKSSTSPTVDITRQDVKLMISPAYKSDKTVFAGSVAGLYKSTDSGNNWHKYEVFSGGAYDYIIGMAISPGYANDKTILVSVKGRGLFKSTDGGITFVEIGRDLINNNYCLELIEFSPLYTTDHTIYGASDEEIFQSTDGGNNWKILSRPVRYENIRDVIHYEGKWKVLKGNDFSASSVTHSKVPSSKATLTFVGTGITWLGTTSNKQGIARVYIDGHPKAEVDQYSGTREAMVRCYSTTGLTNGPHTITVEVTGQKNQLSTDYLIEIDAFDLAP
jgi:hypothetical protein